MGRIAGWTSMCLARVCGNCFQSTFFRKATAESFIPPSKVLSCTLTLRRVWMRVLPRHFSWYQESCATDYCVWHQRPNSGLWVRCKWPLWKSDGMADIAYVFYPCECVRNCCNGEHLEGTTECDGIHRTLWGHFLNFSIHHLLTFFQLLGIGFSTARPLISKHFRESSLDLW